MTYSETIDYLFTRLPMFSRIGAAAIKKDLHNTRQLCELLGNPQEKFKSIHVAGTNGKGSVSHMLAAVLQTAGYKTGLYTSPHLYDFRERIKINGSMIPESFVISFTEKLRGTIESMEPSFFEITVTMAFAWFAEQKTDVAIIETGLGGRLDSTNVILPELSVITNIGWDHMNLLGDSLEKIAWEKAGIIKKNIPVVIGEKQEETKTVFIEKAKAENAPLSFANDLFEVHQCQFDNDALSIRLKHKGKQTLSYRLDLPGIYQLKNIITVLQSVEVLKQKAWQIMDKDIQFALAHTKSITGLHGRWEKVAVKPDVILEAAHNQNGVLEMLLHLQNLSFNSLHFILGTVRDKDLDAMLALFPNHAHYYFTEAQIPRALDAKALKEKAAAFGLSGEVYQDVNKAIQQARSVADSKDLIIVCGSIFLLAEVDRTALQG